MELCETVMPGQFDAPFLLGLLVGFLLALIVWALVQTRLRKVLTDIRYGEDGMLLSLMFFAAFSLGVFLTFVVTARF
jgi:hypothetical protein